MASPETNQIVAEAAVFTNMLVTNSFKAVAENALPDSGSNWFSTIGGVAGILGVIGSICNALWKRWTDKTTREKQLEQGRQLERLRSHLVRISSVAQALDKEEVTAIVNVWKNFVMPVSRLASVRDTLARADPSELLQWQKYIAECQNQFDGIVKDGTAAKKHLLENQVTLSLDCYESALELCHSIEAAASVFASLIKVTPSKEKTEERRRHLEELNAFMNGVVEKREKLVNSLKGALEKKASIELENE